MELKNNVVGSVKLDFKLLLIPGGYLHLIDCAQCCYIFPPSIIYLWNTFLGTICTYRISNIFFRSHAMWASVPKEALPRYHDDTQKEGVLTLWRALRATEGTRASFDRYKSCP